MHSQKQGVKKLTVSGRMNGMSSIFNQFIEVPESFEVTQVEEYIGKQGEETLNKIYYVESQTKPIDTTDKDI